MIEVLKSFTAYPGGEKRFFKAGEVVNDVTKEDAAHFVKIGLAKAVKKGKTNETE